VKRVVCISGEAQGAPRAAAHARAAADAGAHSVLIRQDEVSARIDEVRRAHVLVLSRTPADPALEEAIAAARAGGARIVLDVDERPFERFERALIAADACTCTSAGIAAELQRRCKPAHLLPDGFSQAELRRARRAARARVPQSGEAAVRIGCAAGAAALAAERAASAAVARVLAARPQCRLVPEAQTPEAVAHLDINVAAGEASGRGWLAAALASVPSVAAAGEEECYRALLGLVDDVEARREAGRAAHLEALARCGPERHAERMASLLEQLCGDARREARAFELEHARRARAPAPAPAVPRSDLVLRADRLGEAEVTVVVPLYNYAQYVLEALESVRAQTLATLDLVVVDDASSDSSLEVAERWMRSHAARFNRALLLRNRRNAGLGATRNAGFAAAETPFVLALDADNVLLPACAERCLAALQASGAAFAYPMLRKFGDESGVMGEFDWSPARLAGGNYIDALALIRRSAWAEAGGYQNVRFGWEDYDLWCRFAEHGGYGVRVPEELARYRVHRASMRVAATDVADNRRSLEADMMRRHPWLTL
jgi:GT2 family glycosyltransferase